MLTVSQSVQQMPQTIRSIYNTINHTVTVTGQRSIEVFTHVYGSDKFHKVTVYLHMYINVSSVIASHTLRFIQTIHNIYNTINHAVTLTGQRLIERFTRVYGSDKFLKSYQLFTICTSASVQLLHHIR